MKWVLYTHFLEEERRLREVMHRPILAAEAGVGGRRDWTPPGCPQCLSSDASPALGSLRRCPGPRRRPSAVCAAFQFCEILSAPEVSRWAGPIIDVLLDYVGNVQLCSRLKEHIDSYEDWAVIREKAELPRPLVHLCRLQVRKAVGKYRLKLLDTLPLPGRLIRYLKYENTQ